MTAGNFTARFLRGLLAVASLLAVAAVRLPATGPGPLILVSLDGFRWDYLQKYPAPTLRALAKDGVHATRLISCFPTKTFPNHYTLVTGLRPEHHGIVGNDFFDPVSGAWFSMSNFASNHEARWWEAGEPVWITAEKQQVRAACFFWPGDEVEIHGRTPSLHRGFDATVSIDRRVSEFLQWFDGPPAQRPRFAALYFEMVDSAGHKFGPDSPQTGAAVAQVDDAIARILAGLQARGLGDAANLVIVSDHGMTAESTDRVIFLEDLMDVSRVQVEQTSPIGGVRPKDGDAAGLVARIRAKKIPHLQVFSRADVPAHFFYNTGERIPPVVLIPDEPWSIELKRTWPARRLAFNPGSHGWDPQESDMGALFLAHGPAFRRGAEISAVENIHVYNLLCAVLGITPAPNDGDDRLARAALAEESPNAGAGKP